jgi:peroxiredoxin
MSKKLTIIFFFILIITSIVISSDIGNKVENFTLEDYNGVKHSLNDYKNSKVIVLMFIATRCPVSNAYNERMVQLYDDYMPKGVAFVAINSNKEENVEEIKNHAKDHGFKFTILKDWNNKLADKLEASVTPETYVLNNNFEILYHGRIDDSRREQNVTSKDLRTALDDVLSGKQIEVKETKAFGCTIKRVE